MPGGSNVVAQNSNNRDGGSGFDPTGQQIVNTHLGNITTSGNGYNYGDQFVMIADGANATQGITSDTAYSGSGNATIVAILKGLYTKFAVTGSSALSGYVAATSPPATTTAATDTAYTFSTKVNHLMIQNNTTADIYFALDVSTAVSGTAVFQCQPGNSFHLDNQVTVVHFYTVLAQNINSTAFTGSNIVIAGWL